MEIFKRNQQNYDTLPYHDIFDMCSLTNRMQSFVANTSNAHLISTMPQLQEEPGTPKPKGLRFNTSGEAWINQVYNEAVTTLSLRHKIAANPPIKGIRTNSKSNVCFIDFGSVNFSPSLSLKPLIGFGKLASICLSNCGLLRVPKGLSKPPPTLKYIDLSCNRITELKHKIKWSQLEGLSLRFNAFNSWPCSLSPKKFPKLVSLNISNNDINTIPSFSSGFQSLENLYLDFCSIRVLPKWIGVSYQLRTLSLRGNPCYIGDLSCLLLQFLDISQTKGFENPDDQVQSSLRLLVSDTPCSDNSLVYYK